MLPSLKSAIIMDANKVMIIMDIFEKRMKSSESILLYPRPKGMAAEEDVASFSPRLLIISIRLNESANKVGDIIIAITDIKII